MHTRSLFKALFACHTTALSREITYIPSLYFTLVVFTTTRTLCTDEFVHFNVHIYASAISYSHISQDT